MSVTLTDDEFAKYEDAFGLLEEVYDDYVNFGEVIQDVTIESIDEFFRKVEEES